MSCHEKVDYGWTRWVHTRIGAPPLYRDGGFTVVPERPERWGYLSADDTLGQPGRVVVLLGQPGMGKSTALWRAYRAALGRDDDVRCFDAVACVDMDLAKTIARDFERSVWEPKSGRTLALFIDSLDEHPAGHGRSVARLVADIVGLVERLPLERISLTLTCRTAAWTKEADEAIAGLARRMDAVRDSDVSEKVVFELLPLQRTDVEHAIREMERGRDADGAVPRFFELIDRHGLSNLASRPLSLQFLLEDFHDSGTLQDSAGKVFQKACVRLCYWRDKLIVGKKRRQRLRVAMRMAGLSVLSGRPVIVRDEFSPSDDGDKVLRVADVASPTLKEQALSEELTVEPRMVVDVLEQTRLLQPTDHGFVWMHQEIAEYLASRWLHAHKITEEQLLGLIGFGAEQDACIPQLEGLMRWIDESFDDDIRKRVIRLAPEVALRGDLASRSDDDKALIVEVLLDACIAGQFLDVYAYSDTYHKLAHPGLAEQLQDPLQNRGLLERARRLCARIAGPCGVLTDVLAGIALDPDEPYDIRRSAVRGLGKAEGAKAERLRLRQILDQPRETFDPDDDLRAMALRVLWEDGALNVRELFAQFLPPQQRDVIGLYTIGFLDQEELVEEIWTREREEGLLAACEWAAQHRGDSWGNTLRENIHGLALEHLDDHRILDAMVDVILYSARHRESKLTWFREHLDEQGLRTVVGRMVSRGLKPADALHSRNSSEDRLLHREDVPWLLDWTDEDGLDAAFVESLCQLITSLVWPWDHEMVMMLAERWSENAARYDNAFRKLVVSDIEGEHAATLRKNHEDDEQLRREQESRAAQREARRYTGEDIERALDECVHTIEPSWIALTHYLWLDRQLIIWNGQLEQSPGWQEATSSTRGRILVAAELFLLESDPRTSEWFASNRVPVSAAAGIQAFVLLAGHAPGRLAVLEADILERWTPVLMTLPLLSVPEEARALIIEHIAARAPHGIVSTIRVLLEHEQPVRGLDAWWIPALEPLLVEFLEHAPVSEFMAEWAGYLLTNAPHAARPVIERLLESDLSLPRLFNHAMALDTSHYWPTIWARMQDDQAFAIALLSDLGHTNGLFWYPRLTDDALVDLYRWHIRTFAGSSHLSQAQLRIPNSMSVLERRSTWSAVAALRKLRDERPEDVQVARTLLSVMWRARHESWIPARPAHMLKLLESSDHWLLLHPGPLERAIERVLERWPRRQAWQRVPDDAHKPRAPGDLARSLGAVLESELARVVVNADDAFEVQVSERGLRVVGGRDPVGYPITVDIAVITSFDEEPYARAHESPSWAGSDHVLVLLAEFSGHSWTRRTDHERRRRAHHFEADQVAQAYQERRETWKRDHGIHLHVMRMDMRFEGLDLLDDALAPWGATLRQRLDEQGIEIRDVCTVGDEHHVHIRLSWPDAVRDRFGLAPGGLMLACRGPVSQRDARAAQDVLRLVNADDAADATLDPDLLLVVDDISDLAQRLARMPGRGGQWIPWPAPGFPKLTEAIAQGVRYRDVFALKDAARGRQFFGREGEREDITRRIMNGELVGIFGLRKSGKTSLARAVTDVLDPISLALSQGGVTMAVDASARVLVVWLDMRDVVGSRTEERLWRELGSRLVERLRAGGHAVADLTDRADLLDETGDVFADLPKTLRAILRSDDPRLPGTVCLVFDEYDLLFESAGGGGAGFSVGRLANLLTGLKHETGRLATIFVGRDDRPLQSAELDGLPNPFYQLVHKVWTQGMAAKDAGDMLRVLGARAGLEIDEHTRDHAVAWTGGFPNLLRSMGSALLSARERGQAVASDDRDADDVAEFFLDLDEVRDHLETTFELLRTRYPDAYVLLDALTDPDISDSQVSPRALLARHQGWSGRAARTLRHFGILEGSSREPRVVKWARWYGREMLFRDRSPGGQLGVAGQ